MADALHVFSEAVQFVMVNWPVLKIAVQQGFGGIDSAEKAQWLVEVIVQIFQDNDTVEDYELEDYIAEAMSNEFDTIVEDGSLSKVTQKLCTYHKLCKEGKIDQVIQEVRKVTPDMKMPECVNASQDEVEENGHSCSSGINEGNSSTTENRNTESMDMDHEPTETNHQEADEDGWEVVRRTKKR